jgi:nitrogenase molybdenum-iron protein alpha/beta subunit/MoaA/NifB/PqqE/SkfB family radical SAM enzyme
MATHYNEPVDIASSSLTEEGTVFGGEANLKKGLTNLIKLYNPDLIAISTTCLAETIGEDIGSMAKSYLEERPATHARLVTVNAPGYGGTHYEGWFRALHALVSQITQRKIIQSSHINVVMGPASPADTRAVRELILESGLDCVLFPDISTNLDGAYNPRYSRLPLNGTPLSDLERLASARATLELSQYCPKDYSPGEYLQKTYGVPLRKISPPVGLTETDNFLKALRDLGGKITLKILESRGRLLDAMADSHKYSALGRLAIFGDPDFVGGGIALALENGIVVKLVATGSSAPGLKALTPALESHANLVKAGEVKILDEVDFREISEECERLGVNLLLGSSDGRRFAREKNIPLVRATFPIHDHVGGQRVRSYLYDGSLNLLDKLVNELIEREESTFRKHNYDKYYLKIGEKNPQSFIVTEPAPITSHMAPQPDLSQEVLPQPDLSPRSYGIPDAPTGAGLTGAGRNTLARKTFKEKTLFHPCFSQSAVSAFGRIHLPVAPKCNLSCHYCGRKTDCPHESRPGVTSKILSPAEALEKFQEARSLARGRYELKVVGIAGPGDSLANPEATFETIELIKRIDKDLTFCLSTNGLNLPLYLKDLVELEVSHLTVTVNAVNPEIGALIIGGINYLNETWKGLQAAQILLENQLQGIKRALESGLEIKVNTVLLSGINDTHTVTIAKKMGELGVGILNIMELIPVPGSVFQDLLKVDKEKLQNIRDQARFYLPQMEHCQRCRADAVGLLGCEKKYASSTEEKNLPLAKESLNSWQLLPYKVAVASESGVVVDNHFGKAQNFYIFKTDGKELRLLENRRVRQGCGGFMKEEGNIASVIEALLDCQMVVSLKIGVSPLQKLTSLGIKSLMTYDTVERAVIKAGEILELERQNLSEIPPVLGENVSSCLAKS